MSENDAVLFANEAFYGAFAEGDIDAMEELWAKSVPVSCIHPGWNPLDGREMVMATWTAILSNTQSQKITCLGPKAAVFGDSAIVTCYEEVGGDMLVATNYFIQEGRRWLLVHHQAGPTAMKPTFEEDDNGSGVTQIN